jgi:hypothetical protein
MVGELGILEGMILYKVVPHVKILQNQLSSSNNNPTCGIIKRMKILNLSKGSIRKKHFLMFWGKVSKLTYDPTRWIHYEKLRLPKPHYPTTKSQKTTHIQLLCNYLMGITTIVQLSFRNTMY